jgi:hypothetical protein
LGHVREKSFTQQRFENEAAEEKQFYETDCGGNTSATGKINYIFC